METGKRKESYKAVDQNTKGPFISWRDDPDAALNGANSDGPEVSGPYYTF
jgi:hypothetical protein